jgi:hypothetical protein
MMRKKSTCGRPWSNSFGEEVWNDEAVAPVVLAELKVAAIDDMVKHSGESIGRSRQT